MAITNDPIMLNETGMLIKDALDRQNGYLAMIAEGSRSEVYSSMRQIAGIVRGNDVEQNRKMFPIGDQIVMPWKDMDDPAHNTDENAYQVAWNIVHHGLVELMDGSIVPGMFIQMHKCSAYGVQFSHQQAFYHCDAALEPGTYSFTVNQNYGNTATAGSIVEFTTTKEIPVNGRIYMTNALVVTTHSAGAADPIETITASVVEESSGTDLGTTGSGGLNRIDRMNYGSNRWKTSAIRQYLNKSGFNWFTSQENFDIRPDQYNKQGFMTGFSDEFLNAIKPIKVTTALNTVDGYSSTTEDTFDTFFLPSLEQMNVQPQLAGVEGDYFEYWRSRLGVTGFVGTGGNNVFDAFKIPAINNNSAQYVRLRSASRGNTYSAWHVYASGCVGNYYAYNAYRFSPVCVIC